MVPVTLPKATGGNGAIAYSLTSVPSGLAGLSFDASSRRLSGTPDAAGDYAFTYTAHDADTNRADLDAAVLTFSVTVEESVTALVRQSVRRTPVGGGPAFAHERAGQHRCAVRGRPRCRRAA